MLKIGDGILLCLYVFATLGLAQNPPVLKDQQERVETQTHAAVDMKALQQKQDAVIRRIQELEVFLHAKKPGFTYSDAEQLLASTVKFFKEQDFTESLIPETAASLLHMLERTALRLDTTEFLIAKTPKMPEPELAADREKARRKATMQLEKWEKDKPAKLQLLLVEKNRDGRDTQDTAELFATIDALVRDLKAASRQADAEKLLGVFPEAFMRLNLLATGLEHMLKAKNLPMKQGVTKKAIERARYEEDKRSGCAEFMPDDDRYTICKLRGLPDPKYRSQRQGFNFQLLKDLGVTLPQECRDGTGRAVWRNPPSVDVWQIGDELHTGFVYYVFISKFNGIESLLYKKDVSPDDIARAFVSSCWQDPSHNGMLLIYKGANPVDANSALSVLFRDLPPPHDAFGFDAVALKKELKPPPPFAIEAFLFDKTFIELGRRINMAINPFNAWRQETWKPYAELMEANKVRILDTAEREELLRLQKSPEIIFLIKFNEELRKGLVIGTKSNYLASADALKQSVDKLPDTHAKKAEIVKLEETLHPIAEAYDHHIDENIKKLAIEKKSD